MTGPKFHRVREYASVEPEEKAEEYGEAGNYTDNENLIMAPDWPRSGEIEFRNVTIKYDVEGPKILKDINLRFAAGERIAVVVSTPFGTSPLPCDPAAPFRSVFQPGKKGPGASITTILLGTY